jgi:hypothetical protein
MAEMIGAMDKAGIQAQDRIGMQNWPNEGLAGVWFSFHVGFLDIC